MPIGIIANVLAVALGGVAGALLKDRVSESFKDGLNMIFGGCSMCIGIASITQMENMPAVILAIILGTCLGLAVHLGDLITKGGILMQKLISRFAMPPSGLTQEEFSSSMVTVIVLFCASGTGIYGSMVSGISGDHSILLAKSILDFPTALIFACSLGIVVSLIALPQLVIFLLLFGLAGLLYPLLTTSMINDFKACGGLIIFVTGFRILKLKQFPIADMLPAMALVMPISWIWTAYVLPVLG